jgi:ABC-type Fe3+-hydroxamate transport system substrate-binding protein
VVNLPALLWIVKTIAFQGAAAIVIILLVALGDAYLPLADAQAKTVVDDLGFHVTIKPDIRRVVSLVPTNSEMVCLLECDRLVGGTRYDFYPAELPKRMARKQTAIIGGGFDANLEKIVQLQPDLILTNGPSQQRFAVPLKNLGYPVISLWPRDKDGLVKDFLLLGELLGQQQKAQRFIDEMNQRFATITAEAKNRPKERVYLQMWTDPLITVGKASFTDWLVSAAGGVNIFGDMSFDSGQVGLESLIQRNPDVLIFLAEQAPFVKTLAHRAGWSAIRGVRAGRFCFIDEPDIRRSIMFIEGLEKLHRCLFPYTLNARHVETETQ